VTDADRLRLLFGPYQAPRLHRGDRPHGLYRDALVVVTSWTDAPIPWPRCRTLDSPGGGSGLLVDDELARAVRHESAAAVMHWWGARSSAVNDWRRALGVDANGTEGTRRLRRVVARDGGEAVKCLYAARRREPAPPKQTRPWTAEDDELALTQTAAEAARRTGRMLTAVYQRRAALKVRVRRQRSRA
jgi:hypothetical protein